MTEKTPFTGLDAYIETLMKKYRVIGVPTEEELQDLIHEYKEIREIVQDDISNEQADAYLARVTVIEQHVQCYRDYHYGVKH